MTSRVLLFAAIIFAISAATVISVAQRKPDTSEKPITGDFKITFKTTTGGQSSESTTMIKGLRERDETRMAIGVTNISQVHITQCDMKRNIQINDSGRKYLITPMESDDSGGSSGGASSPGSSGPSARGGVLNLTVNTIDTGERREMFGFAARHLKRTTMMESSPDACQQQKMKIETDGWYINLEYGLNCGSNERPPQMGRAAAGGCRDRYQFKRTGPVNLGFPLIETTTMYGAEGNAMYSSTKEVVELSRQALDASLFDVPAGYTQVATQQELSDASANYQNMAVNQQQSGASNNTPAGAPETPSTANAPARVRVGVVEFNNKTKSSVSTDSMREQLIAMLAGNGIDAVALNASSPGEAAIEAKAKQCAYILYTDVASVKTASAGKKFGGMLGQATGLGSGDTGKSEARLNFRLIATGSSSPTLQSSASSKEDNEQASVSAAIESEAKAVASAAGKM